ncbi:MAG: sulfotransferase, partial [Proteobacteria bacterium]|nr:sulfotransferase [Pseudomonadota bacterium]
MKKFVIVGVQRTGTNLVQSLLDSHSAICCLNEVFLLGTRRGRRYEGPLGYPHYRERSWRRRLGHRLWRTRQVRAYLDSLYATPGFEA